MRCSPLLLSVNKFKSKPLNPSNFKQRVRCCLSCCSGTASNIEEALAIAAEIGRFPLIIRPAFTLGGTGGGISYNLEEFKEQVKAGIDASMTDQVRTLQG
jgi:carbamoyl-phosphate synthase large subunit